MVKFFESLIAQLSGPSPSKPVEEMETSGFILVAGATGGVGRRVVDILRKKGLPVRALVYQSSHFQLIGFLFVVLSSNSNRMLFVQLLRRDRISIDNDVFFLFLNG